MDAVPLGGRPPMAPLPPSQLLGFGTSRWRLQGNAILGVRAGGRGHHLFFLPHESPLLARSGHASRVARCPLSGAKRTTLLPLPATVGQRPHRSSLLPDISPAARCRPP